MCGLGSIFVGAFGSLLQTKIKKFVAFASINQMGFIAVNGAMCTEQAITTTYLFLIIYVLLTVAIFTIILNIEDTSNKLRAVFLTDIYNVDNHNALIIFVWHFVFFALAGVPPTGGFFSKV